MHFCLGVGPLIASFMFGVLLIDYKGYVYVMVCIYPFLSDHAQYVHSPTFSCIYARAVGPFGM